MSRKDDIKKLIIDCERRLQKRKEQQASFGLDAPPHILLEIEDIEAEIKKLQTELEALEDSGFDEESPSDVHGESQRAKTSRKLTLLEKVWIPIIVALIAAITSIIVAIVRDGNTVTTPSTDADFAYQVRVQARDTGEAISHVEVTIEVRGKAPLDDITDAHGLARIFIDSSYTGQPGVLIVRATGYVTHRQHIDLKKDGLPDVVMLDPAP